MGRICSSKGKVRNVHKILVRKPKGKRPFERYRRRWDDDDDDDDDDRS
jgi:hypothetical protein